MIIVEKISKSYGPHQALNSVSFSIEKGKTLGFLGPNGAGKSTTMKVLSGVLAPDKGSVEINGLDFKNTPLQAKASLGYLPENPPLYDNMTVEKYIQFTAFLRQIPQKKVEEATKKAMEKTGLMDVQERLIGNLSKGYRQRIGVAQAIVHEPDFLILDEPTSGLDPQQIQEIRKLISDFSASHTIILSTHILPEVQAVCNQVIVIDKGKIISKSSIKDFVTQISSGFCIALKLRTCNESFIGKIKAKEEVSNVTKKQNEEDINLFIHCKKGVDIRPEIARLCVQENMDIFSLKHVEFSLEEAFLKTLSREKQYENN